MAAPTSGADFRAIRQGLGLSQRQAAELFGVSDRMIRKIESADVIPAGYRASARELAGGRVVAPARRVTTVRAKGGGTRRVSPRKAGTATGVTFERGGSRSAPIVQRVQTWMPYDQTPGAAGAREAAEQTVGSAIRDAHRRGQAAVVTASRPAERGAGGSQAGYTLTVTGLPEGASPPRGAVVIEPGGDWDDADWDELADDAGLTYQDG